jgi:thiamine-phosphate pyrophosphorylase
MDASPKPSRPFFYPIVDTGLCRAAGRDPLALAEACFRGGARWLQLRAKAMSGRDLLALADAIAACAAEHGAALIVNDRADIARMCGAAGVHVGQDDLPVSAVRALAGTSSIVGVSTHDEAQVETALGTDADYIAVGPVYGTATKETGYSARGLGLVRYAGGRGRPVVAIGGITLDRAREVVAAGATGLAVISDVLRGDPERRTREFVELLQV